MRIAFISLQIYYVIVPFLRAWKLIVTLNVQMKKILLLLKIATKVCAFWSVPWPFRRKKQQQDTLIKTVLQTMRNLLIKYIKRWLKTLCKLFRVKQVKALIKVFLNSLKIETLSKPQDSCIYNCFHERFLVFLRILRQSSNKSRLKTLRNGHVHVSKFKGKL